MLTEQLSKTKGASIREYYYGNSVNELFRNSSYDLNTPSRLCSQFGMVANERHSNLLVVDKCLVLFSHWKLIFSELPHFRKEPEYV